VVGDRERARHRDRAGPYAAQRRRVGGRTGQPDARVLPVRDVDRDGTAAVQGELGQRDRRRRTAPRLARQQPHDDRPLQPPGVVGAALALLLVGRDLLVGQVDGDPGLAVERGRRQVDGDGGEREGAAVGVDGRARADRHGVERGRGHLQALADAADVQDALVPALAVEVELLLVDEVLVGEELAVEEAGPLLHDRRQRVVGRHGRLLL
jgi:hypothetical protein